MRPAFVSVEGVEGAGKTTLIRRLEGRLAATGRPVVSVHEPGGTPLGDEIRRLLLGRCTPPLDPRAELLLFEAARAQLVATVIRPALQAGSHVLCDRFADSSIAYQAYGRGLALEQVVAANAIATAGLRPDVTILLDLPAAAGLARKGAAERNRFEEETIAFHERVRSGYHRLAAQDPTRWIICDATAPAEVVAVQAWVGLVSRLDGALDDRISTAYGS
ncbi:MAG: dTMP kinase [Chloroflexi bacterium]|nr:dTMP kinase [Chloroflexota bacterium]